MDAARRHSESSSSSTSSVLEKGIKEIGLDDDSTQHEIDRSSNAASENTTRSVANAPSTPVIGRTSNEPAQHVPQNAFQLNCSSAVSVQRIIQHKRQQVSQALPASSSRVPPVSHVEGIHHPFHEKESLSIEQASGRIHPPLSPTTSAPTSAPSYLSHRQLPITNSLKASASHSPNNRSEEIIEEDRKPAAVDFSSADHHTNDRMCLPGLPVTSAASLASALSSHEQEDTIEMEEQQPNDNDKNDNEGEKSSQDRGPSPKKKRTSKSKSSSSSSQGGDSGHSSGRWTDEEHQTFLRGLHMYGREWKKVASHIPTRTSAQVRSHAQKYFTKMQRDQDAFLILSSSTLPHYQDANSGLGAAQAASGTDAAVAAGNAGEASLVSGLTPAMQSTVARILANPESVEAEVEDTLQRLRERYAQLQQRLQQTEGGASSDAALVQPEPSLLGRKRPAEPDFAAGSCGSTTTASLCSADAHNLHPTLQDEELIALSVLQGVLPRSGGGSSSVGSSHNDTTSATSHCSHSQQDEDEEEEHNDDDTTLTNASAGSNKRSKTFDSSSL